MTTDAAPIRTRGYLVPGEPSRRTGLGVLCVVLVIVFGLLYENYFTVSNGLSILQNVSAIAIAAVGSMFLLIAGNVDLSIGGQLALISVTVAQVAKATGDVITPIAAGLVLGAVLGLINGILVKVMKISPLIVTLGTMSVFTGMAYLVSDGRSVFGFSDAFISIGRAKLLGVPVPVIVALVIFVVCGFWLTRTVAGLKVYAIGGNPLAARLTGVRVDRFITELYVFNGLLIGVVAVLLTARLGSGTPQIGLTFNLDVLTAVILGGVAFAGGSGHPLGVFIGVATIGILNSGMIFAGLQSWWQDIAKGAVLLLALGADQIAQHRRDRAVPKDSGDSADAGDEVASVRGPGEAFDEYGIDGGAERKIGEVVLDARDLSKSFGSVAALRNGSFQVRRGQVVCLVGDNGAGKSTLIKIISGVYRPDSGVLEFDGKPQDFGAPIDARRAGIETVYQDLAVCPNLGIAHNMVLGDTPRRRLLGFIPVRDDRTAIIRSRERLLSLGIKITDMNRSVGRLSGGQRQSVAIARALKDDVKMVILDEPTAALGVKQTRNVLRIVRNAAEKGAGVILISHDIRTVLAVADRVVVLRLGNVVFDGDVKDASHSQLLHLMAGIEEMEFGDVIDDGATADGSVNA